MKKIQFVLATAISFLLFVSSFHASAQWQYDHTYGFKINVPSNWSKNSFMDGTDKVYDFYSPDENAAVQLRAFDASGGVTTDLLIQVYEESMLPAGSRRDFLRSHTSKNGIPGKQAMYFMNYNGNEVAMSTFFTIQNNKGYVLAAIIPVSMLEQKSAEVKSITQSFSIDGFSSTKTGGGLSGLTGGSAKTKAFQITSIVLSDQIDANNRPLHKTNKFQPQTTEIHAVVNFQGTTQSDLIVSWIYNDWDRVISSDAFNFTGNTGGIGVVSMSKPNAGWPEGNYTIKFEMGGRMIKSLSFSVEKQGGQTSSLRGGSGGVTGRYNFVSRSDGMDVMNFHYFVFNSDGSFIEKHQPKDGGGYVSEHKGTYRLEGESLYMNFDWGGKYTYEYYGKTINHKDKQGVVSTFKKTN